MDSKTKHLENQNSKAKTLKMQNSRKTFENLIQEKSWKIKYIKIAPWKLNISRFLCPLKAAPEKGNDLFEENIITRGRKMSRGM